VAAPAKKIIKGKKKAGGQKRKRKYTFYMEIKLKREGRGR